MNSNSVFLVDLFIYSMIGSVFCLSLQANIIVAPNYANYYAVTFPTPADAPVIITIFPSNRQL